MICTGDPRDERLRALDRERVAAARLARRPLRLLVLLCGPGLLVMLGENDGPSMLSYATTGATYGVGFFVPFVVLTFVMAYVVQEQTLRLGIASGRGHAALIDERFGAWWGRFAAGDLLVGNFLTLVTEFVAVSAGARYFGIDPRWAVTAAVAVVLGALAARRYRAWERTVLCLALGNLLFVPAALFAHPDFSGVGRSLLTWGPLHAHDRAGFITLIMADIGATVTPWMLFFQQSAVVDKGLVRADLRYAQIDTAIGTAVAALVAICAIVATAPLFAHGIDGSRFTGAADFATALRPYIGRPGAALLALGMIEAGLVAAMTISTSWSYAAGEIRRRGASLNLDFTSGRSFYLSSAALVTCAAAVVLIPGAPLLTIALAVNVIATLFMPPALLFIVLLANDRHVVGDLANTRLSNLAIVAVLAAITIVGGVYSWTVLAQLAAGR